MTLKQLKESGREYMLKGDDPLTPENLSKLDDHTIDTWIKCIDEMTQLAYSQNNESMRLHLINMRKEI